MSPHPSEAHLGLQRLELGESSVSPLVERSFPILEVMSIDTNRTQPCPTKCHYSATAGLDLMSKCLDV